MSYLTMPDRMPAISKAVMSFWFRVPASTLDATAQSWDTDTSVLRGITPLVVFGDDAVHGYKIAADQKTFGTFTHERWQRVGTTATQFLLIQTGERVRQAYITRAGDAVDKPSCYIGVDCNRTKMQSDPTALPNVLRIRIQLSDMGSGTGVNYNMFSYTGPDLLVDYAGGGPAGASDRSGTLIFSSTGNFVIKEYNPFEEFQQFSDATDIWLRGETEWADIALSTLEVTPDHWHHVLVSFDLTGTIQAAGRQNHQPAKGSITSDCRIWLAYDDVNYKGDALHKGSYDETSIEKPADNALFTKNAAYVARFDAPPSKVTTGPIAFNGWDQITHASGFSKPAYSFTPTAVSASHPLGIPASAKYVDNVHKCEFAEFQMWTGLTLDTSVVANRRAFVDVHGVPVNPNTAEKFLRKRPDVLLHGTAKWKEGKNTGSLGQTPEGEIIPAGQFQRKGVINAYTPDPSLHGAQGPRAGPVRLTRAAAHAGL